MALDSDRPMEARMPELLVSVRRAILGYRNSLLSGVRPEFTAIGRLSDNPLFPAVSILPVRQRPLRHYTGGKLLVERQVNIEFWAAGGDENKATVRAASLAEKFREALRNQKRFHAETASGRPQAFDHLLGTMEISSPVKGRRSVALVSATVPVTFYSKDTYRLPGVEKRRSRKPVQYENRATEAVNAIYELLRGYRRSHLRQVRGFEKHLYEPPVLLGNTINVNLDQEAAERHGAGTEALTAAPTVTVWTLVKASGRQNLLANASLVETVQQLLFSHSLYWEGQTSWSRWVGTDWGVSANAKGHEFYTGQIVWELTWQESSFGKASVV